MDDNMTRDNPVKALFVDDEENILRSLKRLLRDEDMEVFTAVSGEKGLEMLRADEDIGLIVSDQRMPGMSGVEFLEQAKKINPQAMRIILTGYSDINAAIDAINRGGAMRYLAKPWKDEEILACVRDACQRYALIRKNRQLSAVVQRQNEELKRWSQELEIMVQEQTMELSRQNDTLKNLNERQRSNFKTIIDSLSGLIELRDKMVKSHSRNVATISAAAASQMGLPKDEAETILVASLLHDIGKIGLSDFLLAKEPDELTGEGKEEYRLHPVRGQAAIDAIEDLRPAGTLIRHHHESFDGTGFPDGLKGIRIPLGSRIIAMADYIDRALGGALRKDAINAVLESVHEELGRMFDPDLFRYMKRPVTELYGKLQPGEGVFERELWPSELAEGMVLTRDVSSGTGILLLTKGVVLDLTSIKAIKRYYDIDPPKRGVFVRAKQ